MGFTIHPVIPQAEYDAFRLLLKDDLEFPVAYAEWLKRSAEELKKARAKGEVRELIIHAEEFTDWCKRSGINPTKASLGAFATAKAYGK